LTSRIFTYQLIILLSFSALHAPTLAKSFEAIQIEIDDINRGISSPSGIKSDSLSILYYRLGGLYAEKMQYDSAYKYYDLSLNIANENSDKYQLALINNTIGSFYYGCENYDEAHEYYQQSYQLYQEISNSSGIASLANNLGEIERLNGAYRKALEFYNAALTINEKLQHHTNLSINHNNIGLTYAHLKEYDSSFYHLKRAETIALQHGSYKSLNLIQNSLGTYYMLVKKFDSSYYYLTKAYGQSVNRNHLIQIKENSNALSQLFEETGNTDSSFHYHKIFKSYNDSILNNKNLMRMGLLIVRNKHENERRIERMEQSRKELIYIIVFISIFLVLIILILLWVNQRNKTRHSQLRMEHLSLEKKYLNNELTDFALHISENNHLLEEIKNSLKLIEINQGNETHINELKLKLNTGLSNTQNKKILEQKVDEQNREFILKLKNKHPSLTKSELKLCSLHKLNLTTKDIAAINMVSPQAIKVARYRLRKKLQVDSDVRIGDYLNSI